MRQWRKWFRLTWGDRALLLGTWFVLISIRFGLRVLSFRRLMRLLHQPAAALPISTPAKKSYQAPTLAQLPGRQGQRVSVERIIWAVEVSSRYMPGGVKCLARALTTQLLMRRQGYVPKLQIGVAKAQDGQLEAHAWVEYQGKVAIGYLKDLPRFVPLPSVEGIRL
jgi:Transglutaminase-like superfamily